MITSSAPNPRQQGASLLEVLITILIMAFGLLGVAGLSVSSLQTAKLSQFQSTALQLANEYADRMRGNVRGVADGHYDKTAAYTGTVSSVTVPNCSSPTACQPAELAAIDQAEWTNSLLRRLPGGSAYVQYNEDEVTVDIWVIWQAPNMQFDANSDLSAAGTGGSQCPSAALSGYAGDAPACVYYRVSI